MNDYRLKYHLMPPDGWLNDPNGLCQFNGTYHIFFQYSPNTPAPDGKKMRTWGHYSGKSLTDLKFCGIPFWADKEFDKDGCYSGSALVEKDRVRLYYTGNVKDPGEHDYTYSGRQANTILVDTDGTNFSEKRVLMTSADYPSDCTCHVRDPKVWESEGLFHMVLGARIRGEKQGAEYDHGAVLFYESKDGENWTYKSTLTTSERFGYMWECPDCFSVCNTTLLSVCPQGVESEEFRYQNIYQAGYFIVADEICHDQNISDLQTGQKLSAFKEWDYGFDFYAPQTFSDEQGRRILIGWVGMPDAPYKNAEAKLDAYWENCLSIPRVLTEQNGAILQQPIPEMSALRYGETHLRQNESIVFGEGAGDIEINFQKNPEKGWKICFGSGTELNYSNSVLALNLDASAGLGRTSRKIKIDHIDNIRILVDVSLLEIFINDGEFAMTSRFYPDYPDDDKILRVEFNCPQADITAWQIKAHKAY